MAEKISSMKENDVWELVPAVPGQNLLKTKWVFKQKTKADGSIDKFKARLCVKGWSQKYGVDFKDTFAPVIKQSSLKLMIAIAVEKRWIIRQVDVETAFLNGVLEIEIYIPQPEGLSDGTNRVCKLKKAIYGLRQSLRMWMNEDTVICYYLLEIHFRY